MPILFLSIGFAPRKWIPRVNGKRIFYYRTEHMAMQKELMDKGNGVQAPNEARRRDHPRDDLLTGIQCFLFKVHTYTIRKHEKFHTKL